MGLPDIKIVDIQRTHRLGPPIIRRNTRSANVRPRLIIVKFTNFRKIQMGFKANSELKGDDVTITENIPKVCYALYKAAIVKFGRGNVWTCEGKDNDKG